MPPSLEASGSEKVGSYEVTCACTPHFIYNHLLPFGPPQQSLRGLGLVEKIFFSPDGLGPSECAAYFGGASRTMFGHGLADLWNCFNGQKSRASSAKKWLCPEQISRAHRARPARPTTGFKGGIRAYSHTAARRLCPLFLRALFF